MSADSSGLISDQGRRHFLLKVDARHCPDQRARPSKAVDWEDKEFMSIDMPRKSITVLMQRQPVQLPRQQTAIPIVDDLVLIWVNGKAGGSGLTAKACVSECKKDGKRL